MYLLLLGAVNLSRRSLLVSGVRDAAALSVALSGLFIVGPIELFYPFQSAIKLGHTVCWLLVLALYVMCVLLWLLLLRPRLVIYNISADKLRSVLADTVNQLGGDARWAGDSLVIPGLGVQLYIDAFSLLRSASLVSAGGNQSHAGWRRLEGALRASLAREESGRNPRGLILFAAGLVCVAVIVLAIANDPEAVARSLLDLGRSVWRMFDSTAYPQ
jgi:hypothetical protein